MTADQSNQRKEFKAAWSEAVHTSHDGSLQQMVPLLDSSWPAVRSHVVRAIRKRGDVEAVPLLIELASREKDDSVRGAIALALAEAEDPHSIETLWGLFEDGSDGVRQAALQGLSRLGDDRVIPIAISWYESDDRLLRSLGVFDLAVLRTPSGEKALARLLAEASWLRRFWIRRVVRRARRWRSRHSKG